jgi:Gnt-I system high-affinity gluconate transporter
MGLTLLYGLIVAIPAIVIAGPLFSRTLKGIVAVPLKTFQVNTLPEDTLPGRANSFLSSLLPVMLLIITTILPFFLPAEGLLRDLAIFISDPNIVMLIALIVATYTLGISMGKSVAHLMNVYSDAVKDIAMIIFIVAGAGALKQVFIDSGVSDEIATVLQTWNMPPLVLGWLIACIIRVCIGSATVAGLTTAGIMAPILIQSGANPNLMVLAIGAGSLMFSHVNDGGFWMFKEYFNLSMKDTLRSWSLMETIVAVVGLIGVMLLNIVV